MIGSVVSVNGHELGWLTEASVETFGWEQTQTYSLIVRRHSPRPRIPLLPDAEEIARTEPGTGGW